MPDIETAAAVAREKITEKMSAMSFLEHLEELRKRIIWSIAAVGIAFMVCWRYSDFFYGYMQKPIMEALEKNHLERN